MKVLSKVWLVSDKGRIIFGEGRLKMLQLVEELGSMNRAAAEMGMSYRTLWGKLHATEEALGVKLLETSVGGGQSGGTRLTDEARKLMACYRTMNGDVTECADKTFKSCFGRT